MEGDTARRLSLLGLCLGLLLLAPSHPASAAAVEDGGRLKTKESRLGPAMKSSPRAKSFIFGLAHFPNLQLKPAHSPAGNIPNPPHPSPQSPESLTLGVASGRAVQRAASWRETESGGGGRRATSREAGKGGGQPGGNPAPARPPGRWEDASGEPEPGQPARAPAARRWEAARRRSSAAARLGRRGGGDPRAASRQQMATRARRACLAESAGAGRRPGGGPALPRAWAGGEVATRELRAGSRARGDPRAAHLPCRVAVATRTSSRARAVPKMDKEVNERGTPSEGLKI